MTRKEFLAALKKTPRDWFIDANGKIRRPFSYTFGYPEPSSRCFRECPITSLDGHLEYVVVEVGLGLSLPIELIGEIIGASDGRSNIKYWYLRRQIKKACGL